MMQMLKAAGLILLVDDKRSANIDNPKGYYEYDPVKTLESDASWLRLAKGKTVKIVSELLLSLPNEYRYKILFMTRNIDEILISQELMLEHRGMQACTPPDSKTMAAHLARHLSRIREWLAAQGNIDVLYCSYNSILRAPLIESERIGQWLNGSVDPVAMADIVDDSLYRQRR